MAVAGSGRRLRPFRACKTKRPTAGCYTRAQDCPGTPTRGRGACISAGAESPNRRLAEAQLRVHPSMVRPTSCSAFMAAAARRKSSTSPTVQPSSATVAGCETGTWEVGDVTLEADSVGDSGRDLLLTSQRRAAQQGGTAGCRYITPLYNKLGSGFNITIVQHTHICTHKCT